VGLNKAGFASALIFTSLIGTTAGPAQAAYVVTLTQDGSNLVAAGSGTLDLTDLSFDSDESGTGDSVVVVPQVGLIAIGLGGGQEISAFTGLTGPTNFGTSGPGGNMEADNATGDYVGVYGVLSSIFVPASYISGSPLSDSATWDNQSFSSVGATPGAYKWTWGSGTHADSFTLEIGGSGPSPVPEPATWAMLLLGFAGLGYVGWRTQRKTAATA
jgi:hypothetical protein